MKIYPDCFPCFFRQASIAFENAGIDHDKRLNIFMNISKEIYKHELSVSPAHVTTRIHRLIRDETGLDPFASVKSEYNSKAMELYDELKEMVASSDEPLLTASRLAIAGNIIDFGIFTSVNIEATIERSLRADIDVDDFRAFMRGIEGADEVLYILDNTGEIVFDRILIEAIMDRDVKVVAAVKGSPVINDATIADASVAGLTDICRVIDNGSDAVGTILKYCSKEFVEEFLNAGMVISKGQANFETLMNEEKDNIFFLFQAKCDVVAEHLGVDKGAMIFADGAERWR